MDRMLDSRRILIVGLALTLSISRNVIPDFYAQLPQPIQPFVASDLVIGVIAALVLNALFRIGIRQRVSISIVPSAQAIEQVQHFLEEQGARWSVRRDVMARVIFGTAQTLEVIFDQGHESRPVIVEAVFDEYNLDISLTYEGEPIELVNLRVAAFGVNDPIELPSLPQGISSAGTGRSIRPVYFEKLGYVETSVFKRDSLRPDMKLPGPAVVEEATSATLIPPGATADVAPDLGLFVKL